MRSRPYRSRTDSEYSFFLSFQLIHEKARRSCITLGPLSFCSSSDVQEFVDLGQDGSSGDAQRRCVCKARDAVSPAKET
jgi:hypothetical protein